MSEVIGWTIMAIIAAVILSWGVTARRTRSEGIARADSFLRRQPVLLGLVAIALAGMAQLVLQQDQPVFAAIGYGFAVFLFVSALRPWIPVTVLVDPSILTARPAAKSMPSQPGSARPRSAFLQTWRYYTLDNLLKGTPPNIPGAASAEPPREVASDLTSPAAATTVEIFAAAQPAAVRVWTGFDRPQSVCVTARGNVFVLDGARQCVYCLNPLGQIIRTWSLPDIPELQSCHAAVSPDGRQLYLTDPARGQVYSVTLREDQL